MTGHKWIFLTLIVKSKGFVSYEDNNKGKILEIGKVGMSPFTTINNVIYVEGLKHNILSISQLYDKGLKINFKKDSCIIEDEITHEIKLVRKKINNIFMISLDDLCLKLKCLMVNNNDAWLWHEHCF